jgi:ribosomal protein S18 acetylase RimI-like enzyme
MSWRKAGRADIGPLMALLLQEEWRSVPFTARLKLPNGKAAPAALPRRSRARVFLRESSGGIDGAMLLTSGGLMLPRFYGPGEALSPAMRKSLLPLHSVMGVSRDVRQVEDELDRRPDEAVDYYLMTLEARDFHPLSQPPDSALVIRQARPEETSRLFPLQQGYELEEVVLNPQMYSRRDSYLHFKHTLRRQLVLVAELGGSPVAKAGTNACGFGVAQIGGVYTLPTQRNRGIGFRVMAALLERIFAVYPQACLFVKQSNPAALALYHRLGFRTREDYRISYFGL